MGKQVIVISDIEHVLAEIREVLEGELDGDDCETDVAAEIYEALMIALDEGFLEGYEQGKRFGMAEGFQMGWDEGVEYDQAREA